MASMEKVTLKAIEEDHLLVLKLTLATFNLIFKTFLPSHHSILNHLVCVDVTNERRLIVYCQINNHIVQVLVKEDVDEKRNVSNLVNDLLLSSSRSLASFVLSLST